MSDQENIFQKQQEEQKKLESLSKETGFDVSIESVPLPSQGLVYSVDHPFCNAQTVELKMMTAKEEDLLTSRSLIKSGHIFSKLIQSCLVNKAVDPDSLLIGDRNTLLISLRCSGYGTNYDVKISCPQCGEDFDYTFDMGKLPLKPLGAMPLQPNINLFEYVLPLSGLKVHFKLLTGKDEFEISQQQEREKKILKSQFEKNITTRMFYSIVSIGGDTNRDKILRIVNNLRAGDARAFRNYINKIEPDVEMKQMAICPKCGEIEVEIPIGVTFLYPDVK
jgi:hypothetical protein